MLDACMQTLHGALPERNEELTVPRATSGRITTKRLSARRIVEPASPAMAPRGSSLRFPSWSWISWRSFRWPFAVAAETAFIDPYGEHLERRG